jgi:hypothetical protein
MRKTLVVDFGVERHTLITREITQVFHQSSATVSSSKGALIQGEGATSKEVLSQLVPSWENPEIPF